ncbi:MAG: bifunctional aspartate kinase/homoserine dehydrogenase I [Bacteroidales bacterium]|nr:bifunctional aspartate kinase/homoserine dehydrogenase I [Bacteroidales bacterium]
MRVLKFGGTSVGTAEALHEVKTIVSELRKPAVIVVSALGGITDRLIETAHKATRGDDSYEADYKQICQRHFDIITAVVPSSHIQTDLVKRTARYLDDLHHIFQGLYLIHDLSEKTLNTVVSYGERLSSRIIATMLDATCMDARQFIKTERKGGRHVLDTTLTKQSIRATLGTLPQHTVVPGFIASDRDTGEITNLGRGGSDYTAALIAAALGATQLEIWSDVDGFMTGDPRLIPTAYPIETLSYGEATELCNFGAKVVYPPTIHPVYHKNIPILIRNTFNRHAPGTRIHKQSTTNATHAIKGISSISDTSLITIQGLGMVGVVGVNERIFRTLSAHNISAFFVSQAASENNTSIGVRSADAMLSAQVLNEEFAKEIASGEINEMWVQDHLATVAVVGEAMRGSMGVAGKLFGTLGRNGINVVACAQGAAETNISFIIRQSQLHKTLNVLHDSFFLSPYQVLNVFICGIGIVGSDLIDQIQKQQDKLIKKGLKINVIGIANSQKLLLNEEGVDLINYRQQLDTQGIAINATRLAQAIIDTNAFNAVFVDCTASEAVADTYETLLEHNVNIVAANKIVASSQYDRYQRIKSIVEARDAKFLYETNVGAGLPILNTINNLINCGDRIVKLEAVLSGTLNYVFNTMSAEIPFSQAIRMAQEAGFAEPDPRIDLSGADVVRKLVILAREAGYRLDQSEVEQHLFLPAALFEGTIDDFWAGLPALDAEWERRRQACEAEGLRQRFVARYEDGKASVQLETVPVSHSFYELEGSNNIVLITSERYDEYPLLIQGYGAGASVTAAGVFADIISIANIR